MRLPWILTVVLLENSLLFHQPSHAWTSSSRAKLVLRTDAFTTIQRERVIGFSKLGTEENDASSVDLPSFLETPASLNKFRALMGSLYGIAGLAHFADLVLGQSTMLTTAGAPVFSELPLPVQMYAILWCASGPLAFAMTREDRFADAGLIVYGVIEILGALLLKWNGFPSGPAVANAILIQVVIRVSWIYSSSRKDSM
jgi:hypothetical protein